MLDRLASTGVFLLWAKMLARPSEGVILQRGAHSGRKPQCRIGLSRFQGGFGKG